MKKIFCLLFIVFTIKTSIAEEFFNNTISVGLFDSKNRIKILRPCLITEEQTVESTLQDKIEQTNSLLNDSTTSENVDSVENNQNITTKTVYSNYINEHNSTLFYDVYSKIINNLDILNLFFVDYDYNSCSTIMVYGEKNNFNDISDYIFSKELEEEYDYVVSGDIHIINEHEIKFEVFVWDLIDQRFLGGKYYIIDVITSSVDKIANLVSDFIFQTTTGETGGLFDSKIIYISETGGVKNRKKQVSIMNFDGSKNTKITNGNNMKLTPIFSKYNKDEIFYLEYLTDGAYIIKHNLKTNQMSKISTNKLTMTSAATFNPNGKNQLIVSGSEEDCGTNLYLFDLDNKLNKKITKNKNINTSASFNPDGTEIVYVSDKSGARRIYKKNINNNKEEQISSGSGIHDKPSWSPDGRLVAFIKITKGKFGLYVMTHTGDGERLLASGYLIEGVKWSPNSRYLIYTKQTSPFGKGSIPKIYIMDILTRHEYQLKTPENEGASDPDWIINE